MDDVTTYLLARGRIVRLEKLGKFYPANSSQGKTEAKYVSSNFIRRVSVNYRPGNRILSALKDTGFKKLLADYY